ncbi:MAG TPA: COX15/CtaA family protein [Flavitalea sp.]|nr:COX15/CtaA family protein [Flavitalea sp.]
MKKFNDGSRAVAVWIGLGVIMLIIQVILGGVTRLTGSGLSITEWNVVTGTLPPLSERQWLAEFDKYRQTPQFQLLNMDFKVEDFKFIFFWEWLHRFWARLIGMVFIVGYIYLVARRYLKKEMVRPLLILFLLGALQGAVGWIMVASGLTGDAVYVKPTRLALHFIFAMGLIAYAFWFLLDLRIPAAERLRRPKTARFAVTLVVLTSIQLAFGALMAGHKASTAAPTWPDINGNFFPTAMFQHSPAILNLVDNKITIHFIHRSLAYLLIVLIACLSWNLSRNRDLPTSIRRCRLLPFILVVVQAGLGIASLLFSRSIVPGHWRSFEWFAQLHQVTGMLLVLSLITIVYQFTGEKNLRPKAELI